MQEQSSVTRHAPRARAAGLVERLESTRADMRSFHRTRGLLRTALVALALAGLLAALDWWLVLPTAARGIGLLALGALSVVLLGYGLITASGRFNRRDAAAEVETAFPQLGQRVRTTLDYAEPDAETMAAAPGLVQALAADTDQRTRVLDFRGLIPWRSLRWLTAGLIGLAALFGVLLVVNPEARVAALRLFLAPAGYTRLEVSPGDQTLKVGSDLTVQATLTGRPVGKAELQYRPAGSGGDWATISLAPPDLEPARSPKLLGTLETTLKECRDDLEYRVAAGPVESPVYRLTITRPLVLKGIEAEIQPPAYTRRPAAMVKEGNLKVIAGSRVRFHITLDREPSAARLLLSPAGTPPVALEADGNVLTGELPSVEKAVEYDVDAVAADGMRLEDTARFRIEAVPDRKPTVRFVKPKEQIEVTPTSEVHMRVEASDDFGLSAVGIVYQVGKGPRQTLLLHRDPAQPTSLKVEAVLALEEHELTPQDAVTYYAFAEDNHPNPPQRTTTELQFIDIRPYKRTYQLLETGGS
jgi:hypothetical protein